MLIDTMVKALRDGEIDINSPEFVKEMQALHRDEWMAAARAEQGQKDDRFMALGIVYMSLHILEITGKQQSVSFLRQKRAELGPALYRESLFGDEHVTLSSQERRQESTKGVDNRMAELFGSHYLLHPGSEREELD